MRRGLFGAAGALRTVCARVALPAAQETPGELRSTEVRPGASAGPSTSPLVRAKTRLCS